jgi:hypothetical protein
MLTLVDLSELLHFFNEELNFGPQLFVIFTLFFSFKSRVTEFNFYFFAGLQLGLEFFIGLQFALTADLIVFYFLLNLFHLILKISIFEFGT